MTWALAANPQDSPDFDKRSRRLVEIREALAGG